MGHSREAAEEPMERRDNKAHGRSPDEGEGSSGGSMCKTDGERKTEFRECSQAQSSGRLDRSM